MSMRKAFVASAMVCVLSGCGSGPNAQEWADDVCTSLKPWAGEISDLTEEANGAMGPQSSPKEAQKELVTLLSGAAEATETAREGVEKAGVPDVDSGEAIADRFTSSLAETRDAYSDARDGIESLDASEDSFYDDVSQIMTQLDKDYQNVPQVASLNSDELRDAFAQLPDCT